MATQKKRHMRAAVEHHEYVMTRFLQRDSGYLLEWLRRDYSPGNDSHGTAVCPGHAIESMWFQIHIARATSSRGVIDQAVNAIRFHLDQGWDDAYGGLFLAIDARNRNEVAWPHATMKLWWPHTEAMYATLLAYEQCEEHWCLEWHLKVGDYSFSHFRHPPTGEWTQKLDRYGNVVRDVLFLPVKDPFHLPRSLIYCIDVLDRICERAKQRDVTKAL